MIDYFKRNPIVFLYTALAIGCLIALIMWITGDQGVKEWMKSPLTKATNGDIIIFIIAFGIWATPSRSCKS